MKRLIFGALLVTGTMIFSGCGLVFVARTDSRVPAYCRECRYVPLGRAAHAGCGHYDIRIVRNGYYFRPRMSGKLVEFKFAEFDHSGRNAHEANRDNRRSRR